MIRLKLRLKPVWIAVLNVMCLPTTAFAEAQMIDDFDAPGGISAWSFGNGGEFPGATGSLAAGEGVDGDAAVMRFDFTGGGRYVQMQRDLTGVSSGDTLMMAVRADALVSFTFRVTDATGQTIQFRPHPPFESIVCDEWCPLMFSPDTTRLDYWGGADDGVVHDAVVSFAILVGRSEIGPLSGEIAVDNFQKISLTDAAVDPYLPGNALSGADADELFGRLGAAVHRTGDTAALDALEALGFGWVRTDMWWNTVETEAGQYDFSRWDEVLQSLEGRGMSGIFILDYGNDLYGGGPPRTAEAVDAYGEYAKAASLHFMGKPLIFELWNEPDGPGFWPPDGNQPLEYAALLDAAVDRIHEGDPGARISTGGISWFFFDYIDALLETGAADGVDYFGVHAYGSTPPETLSGNVRMLRRMLTPRFDVPPPVINTEWGFSSVGLGADGHSADARHRQAVLGLRSVLAGWVTGMPISVWYDAIDDCEDALDNECNFGLLDSAGNRKPLYEALSTLREQTSNRRLSSILSNGGGPHVLRLEGTSDAVLVLWLSSPDTRILVTVPAPLDAADMYGMPSALDADGSLALSEADGPVYLRYPRGDDGDDSDDTETNEATDTSGSVDTATMDTETSTDSSTSAADRDTQPREVDTDTDAYPTENSTGAHSGCGCAVTPARTPSASSVLFAALLVFSLRPADGCQSY